MCTVKLSRSHDRWSYPEAVCDDELGLYTAVKCATVLQVAAASA